MASSSITAPVTVADPGFNGVSKFASSLQQVLTREIGIASLPLNSLQAGLTTLNNKQSALQGVDTAFTSLQSAVSALQSTVSSGLLSASVSDNSIASAQLGSSATPGTYSINVQSLGSYSTALSVAGATAVSDPTSQGISSSSPLTLTVGSDTFTITPASSSLQDLASAINSQAGADVQATLVNVGSSSSPDYRLSLSSVKLTSDSIGLTDSTNTDLIQTATAGSPATYTVDDTASVSSDSRTITLAPGLTVNLLGQSTSGQDTTISVNQDASLLESAFSSFASAYNSAAGAIAQQRGQNAGPLQGSSLLGTLSEGLSQLATYSNGDPSSALANFGVTVDENGQLSVDASTFTSAAQANFSQLLSTLGSSTGGGFLGAATNLMTDFLDPTTGDIKTEESTLATQISDQNTKISDEQNTVNQLQTSLTAEISQADSTIAGLESQVSYVTGLFAQYTGASNTQANGLSTL